MGGTPIALCIIESPIEMHDLGVPHDLGILNIKNKCTSHSECCTPKLICWTGIVQLQYMSGFPLVCNVSLNLYLHDSPQECGECKILGQPTWCKAIPAVSRMNIFLQSSCEDQKNTNSEVGALLKTTRGNYHDDDDDGDLKKADTQCSIFKHPHNGVKHNHFPYHLPWTKSGKLDWSLCRYWCSSACKEEVFRSPDAWRRQLNSLVITAMENSSQLDDSV